MPPKAPLSLATIWSLLRTSSWEICSLRDSCGCANEVEHPAVSEAARYIINVFSLMSPYSGFRVEDWHSLIPGVSSPLHGAGEDMLFLSAWSQGEQGSPHADVQMEREQVSPGACLVSPVPCQAAGMWLLPVPREQTWPHISQGGQEMGQGVSLCAVSCITYGSLSFPSCCGSIILAIIKDKQRVCALGISHFTLAREEDKLGDKPEFIRLCSWKHKWLWGQRV